jgi:hypothetical protein
VTAIIQPENLGSGAPPARPGRTVKWSECREFQEEIEAEGRAIFDAFNYNRNLQQLVSLILVCVDRQGARLSQDPLRAGLSIGWVPEGSIIIRPEWSVIIDRPPAVNLEGSDARVQALAKAPRLRGPMAELLRTLVVFARAKGISVGQIDFGVDELSDGTLKVTLWDKQRRQLRHAVTDVPWAAPATGAGT